MNTSDPVTSILLQILGAHPKEPAARLKQRLSAAMLDQGVGPFDQKAVGHRTFKDYLKSLGDLLIIEERAGSDILVSLRHPSEAPSVIDDAHGIAPPLKSDVWLAFTNPDSNRARFFNVGTKRVVHFPTSQDQVAFRVTNLDLIPIPPIDAVQQSTWMREFLIDNSIDDALPASLTEMPYSNTMNAVFSRALGKQALAWRKFRASKVLAVAEAWAQDNNIEASWIRPIPESNQIGAGPSMSPRIRATKLLESFSDQELIDTVIPILAASALVKSRS